VVGGELVLLLFERAASDGEAEYTVRFGAGMSVAEHRIPVTAPGLGAAGTAEVSQKSCLARLTVAVFGTTLAVGHRWHRYADGYRTTAADPLAPPVIDGGPKGLATSDLWGAVEGLPDRDLLVSLDEYMGGGFTVMASHRYATLAAGGGVARETAAKLSHVYFKCVQIQVGRLWVRRSGETTPYTTLGLTVRM